MKKSAGVFLLIIVLALAQCAKKATLVDPSFIGVWQGVSGTTTYKLSIDDNSNAFWVRHNNGHYDYAQGIARVSGDEMRIGIRRFQINEFPLEDTATNTWTMVLSGITYTRN